MPGEVQPHDLLYVVKLQKESYSKLKFLHVECIGDFVYQIKLINYDASAL